MPANTAVNLWSSSSHATDYLGRAASIPHRDEGESTLLEFIPAQIGHAKIGRILDLGTGDGRLLALVKSHLAARDEAQNAAFDAQKPEAVAVDFSPAMLEAARKRFAGDSSVTLISHNLDNPLPALGKCDAVISSFAIHHLVHDRKRTLYAEIYALLNPSGVFCNLEHVASPTPRLHEEFLQLLGITPETEDPSNKLLDLETQLRWLREIGFIAVDCHWKWRELALIVGRKA